MLIAIKGVVRKKIPLTATGFTMVNLDVGENHQSIVGGGDLGAMREDDCVVIIGREENHQKYGRQTKVIRWWYENDCPFHKPEEAEKAITFLVDELKLPPKTAENIFDAYLENAETIIRENPYRLVTDGMAKRISINTIDKYIAPYFSIPATDRRRLSASIVSLLKKSRGLRGPSPFTDETTGITHGSPGGGHVFLSFSQVIGLSSEEMELPRKIVAEEVRRMATTPRNPIDERPLLALERDGEEIKYVYSHALSVAEKGLAYHIKRINKADIDPPQNGSIESKIELSPEQKEAVTMALQKPLSIITGGPGVGKTTIISAITNTLKKNGKSFNLCAPTGVASRRIERSSGEQASTIHRLLKIDPGRGIFQMGQHQPLQTNFVICDESSMVDLPLMYSLLSAVSTGTQVLLVGDVDQLPPVGPGYPFRDMIKWGKLPTTILTKIYRQEIANSLIIKGSKDILSKKTPTFGKDTTTEDMFRFQYRKETEAIRTIIDLVIRKIPSTFKIPQTEIQILSPLRRRTRNQKNGNEYESVKILSADNINIEVQRAIHGKSPENGERFFDGDRVIHTKNNYDLDVMNGEIGYIRSVRRITHSPKNKTGKETKTTKVSYQVEFDGRMITYDQEDAKELQLAYALSVHKAQGTESPAVIVVAHPVPGFFSRNMLYTATTRGKRVVIMLTPSDGSAGKILKTDETARNSLLIRWLEEQLEESEFPPIKLDEVSGEDD